MRLPTHSQPSHPGVHFSSYTIFPEYEEKFLPIPAMLLMENSQITSQKFYLTVDTKVSFTDHEPLTEK